MASYKLTIIGDSAVGKTSILLRHTDNFRANYPLPTICNEYESTVHFNGQTYNLQINDTGGIEGYESIRRFSFYNVDCFILCFAINSRQSFDNIVPSWISAIQIVCNDYKLILVGTKADMREKTPNICVSKEDIEELAKNIRASAYVECSAYKNFGVDDIFKSAIKSILT